MEILLKQHIIHVDETLVRVLKEESRKAKQKSYMWLYKSGEYDNQIVLYDYQPSRSHKNPKGFLRGFKGYLQTDGYMVYEKLNNVTGRMFGACKKKVQGFHEHIA